MSLTFKPIVDAVLAGGFNPSKRAEAQEWVRFRHAWLWDLDDWTFKYGTCTPTFTANSQIASLGVTDFHAAVALYDAQGNVIKGVRDFREFFDQYNTNAAQGTGAPEAYTIVDGQLFLGPKGDGSTGLMIYEKAKPSLVEDDDPTGLPDGYDLGLVHGGKAEGFKLTNVPLWQSFDDDFSAMATAMQRNWTNQVKEQGQQFGSYTAGAWG